VLDDDGQPVLDHDDEPVTELVNPLLRSEELMPDTENADPTTPLTDETTAGEVETPDTVENPPEDSLGTNTAESAGDTFPRKVVEDLRKESAGYRDRAKAAEERSDTLARQLFTARVAATEARGSHRSGVRRGSPR